MKILYAEDEVMLRELYAMQLEALTDCKIIEVSSGNEAIEVLKADPEVALVMSDYRMPNGNGDVVYQYVRAHKPELPFFLISTYDPHECPGFENFSKDHPNNTFFAKPIDSFKILAEKVKGALNVSPSLSAQEKSPPMPEYCKVKLPRFLRFNNSNCPIFIKLSDEKFVKIINKDDLYDTSIIEKYALKHVEYLYVTRQDFISFVDYYKRILEASIANQDNLSPEKMVDTYLASISFIHEMVTNMGLNHQVIEVINQTVDSALRFINKNKNIFQFFDLVLKRQNFIFEHSLMMAYLTVSIAREMDWMTPATLQKLCTAALLHDLMLEDTSNLPLEQALNNPHDPALSRRESEMINSHPISAANLIKSQVGLPPDLDWIILCHHEHPNGTGYPRGLKADKIPPLACIFILAENFSRRLYAKTRDPQAIEAFAKEIATQFDQGNFKKPVEGLLALIKKLKID